VKKSRGPIAGGMGTKSRNGEERDGKKSGGYRMVTKTPLPSASRGSGERRVKSRQKRGGRHVIEIETRPTLQKTRLDAAKGRNHEGSKKTRNAGAGKTEEATARILRKKKVRGKNGGTGGTLNHPGAPKEKKGQVQIGKRGRSTSHPVADGRSKKN